MPMTQKTAQNLLDTYKVMLKNLKTNLREDDKKNPIVKTFIPNLLEALMVISGELLCTHDTLAQAKAQLESSVQPKQPSRNGSIPETTLEYLARTYETNALLTLQDDIRVGLEREVLKMPSELQAQIQAHIKEGLEREVLIMPSELQAQIKEGLSLKAVSHAEVPSIAEEPVGAPTEGEPESEANDAIELALWLQRGALTVCFIASLAACVVAAMTLNPVIGGVGVAATAITGFALAQSFGFFSNHSDDLEEDMTRSVDSIPVV